MRGDMLLHVVHIEGTGVIKEGIDRLSRGYDMGGVVRGLDRLQFFPLNKVVV